MTYDRRLSDIPFHNLRGGVAERTLCRRSMCAPRARLYVSFILLTLAVMFTLPAIAQDGHASPSAAQTGVVVEEQSDRVIIQIGGKPVMEITADGVHVHGDISFEGVIRDTGPLPPRTERAEEDKP